MTNNKTYWIDVDHWATLPDHVQQEFDDWLEDEDLLTLGVTELTYHDDALVVDVIYLKIDEALSKEKGFTIYSSDEMEESFTVKMPPPLAGLKEIIS